MQNIIPFATAKSEIKSKTELSNDDYVKGVSGRMVDEKYSEVEIQKAKDFFWQKIPELDKLLIIGHATTTSLKENKIDYNEVEIGYKMFHSE